MCIRDRLCFLYEQIRKTIGNLYRKQEEIAVSWFELFIEIYVDFEAMEDITVDGVRETLCSFMRDNTEIFTEASVDAMINPCLLYTSRIKNVVLFLLWHQQFTSLWQQP